MVNSIYQNLQFFATFFGDTVIPSNCNFFHSVCDSKTKGKRLQPKPAVYTHIVLPYYTFFKRDLLTLLFLSTSPNSQPLYTDFFQIFSFSSLLFETGNLGRSIAFCPLLLLVNVLKRMRPVPWFVRNGASYYSVWGVPGTQMNRGPLFWSGVFRPWFWGGGVLTFNK